MREPLVSALVGCLALCGMGCAATKPEPFLNERARAERHYSHGRYAEAATAWKRAAAATDRRSDETEAHFRAASAELRAGNLEAAARSYKRVLAIAPDGSRAARAAYELGLIEIEQGRPEQGEKQLALVITRYQESALAERAFLRLLSRLEQRRTLGQLLEFVDETLAKVSQPELSERLCYTRAGLLARQGRHAQAKLEYLRMADRFPYPEGALWDDALWHAAELERQQGKPEQALAHLERMLKEVEPAHFQGSYARSRYAEAQFRIAEIYRDDLAREREALVAFRKVFSEHPTSLLRDDALWQEALLARRTRNDKTACSALELLLDAIPESRFAPCAPLLCPRLRPPTSRSCRRYIERSLAAPSDASQPPDASSPQSSK